MPENDTLAWVERTLALPVYANPAPDSYGEGVRDTLRTVAKLMHAERTNGLIDRSSFGDADSVVARESVSDEKARDLVERSKRAEVHHDGVCHEPSVPSSGGAS
jgi:hypothetical protein